MERFIYCNLSPDLENKNDCVTRAITFATGLDYSVIRKKLRYTARLLDCERLCWSCYSFLLTNVFLYKQVNCDDMSIGEFADLHPIGTYLVRMEQHISIIIDNTIMDIFDCRNHSLTDAWEVR